MNKAQGPRKKKQGNKKPPYSGLSFTDLKPRTMTLEAVTSERTTSPTRTTIDLSLGECYSTARHPIESLPRSLSSGLFNLKRSCGIHLMWVSRAQCTPPTTTEYRQWHRCGSLFSPSTVSSNTGTLGIPTPRSPFYSVTRRAASLRRWHSHWGGIKRGIKGFRRNGKASKCATASLS